MAFVSAFAVVCQNILIERDNVPSLVRMVDVFTAIPNGPRLADGTLPPIPMQLYINVRFTPDDTDEHEVGFKLVRPNGEEKMQTITKMTPSAPLVRESDKGMNICIQLGVAPEQLGRHEIVAFVDGREVAKTAFFITQPAENAAVAVN